MEAILEEVSAEVLFDAQYEVATKIKKETGVIASNAQVDDFIETLDIVSADRLNEINFGSLMHDNLVKIFSKVKPLDETITFCVICMGEYAHIDNTCTQCGTVACDGILERDCQIENLAYENKMMVGKFCKKK